MRGRPGLITSYERDIALFRTGTQRFWLLVLLLVAVWLPLWMSNTWLVPAAIALFAAIGAIGLNLVTGYAGQVSLGHAFFLGIGAYTATALSTAEGPGTRGLLAYGLDMIIWLPVAGLVAAILGVIVAPVALRLKGLYLAFVTLGLVFLGQHLFQSWRELSGGSGIGRRAAELSLLGFRFDEDGEVFGVFLTDTQKIYFLGLVLLIVFALVAKNLARSRIGRAFSAIRDRDIAAEIMGIDLTRYKVIAFAISSFYAGVAGALLFTVTGFLEPNAFNLSLSIFYVAMVLIGGVATISGSIMGAVFVTMLPNLIDLVSEYLPYDPATGPLNTGQLEAILFGLLIVLFLIFEPLGLYGLWIRIRNYWKAWPFSY
jgi:branched-chain amino acid transport system permease protein